MISTWTSLGSGMATAFAAVGPFVLVVTRGREGPAAWWRTLDGDLIGRARVGRA